MEQWHNKARQKYSSENMNPTASSTWEAPANIALVKYWGKTGTQEPLTPSISMSLQESKSITYLKIFQAKDFSFKLRNPNHKKWTAKMDVFFKRILPFCPFLETMNLEIETKNTFPHSAGMASSASGFAALALGICDLEQQLQKRKMEDISFYEKASFLARLGSGSACRSIWPGFNWWGASSLFPPGQQERATPYPHISPDFKSLRDSIVIISKEEKKISSSEGHERFIEHPFRNGRKTQVNSRMKRLQEAMEQSDWELFISLVEEEALSLHALMMSSSPAYMLLRPESIEVWNKVQDLRRTKKLPIAMTMDAGPNIHLIYPAGIVKKLIDLFQDLESKNFKLLHDRIGKGPKKRTKNSQTQKEKWNEI